jgi:hypothetical protein
VPRLPHPVRMMPNASATPSAARDRKGKVLLAMALSSRGRLQSYFERFAANPQEIRLQ